MLVEVASGVTQPIELESDEEVGNPTWSPDGQSLVFARLEPEGPRLFRVGLEAGARPQPISDRGWFDAIETPDGLFAVHRIQDGIWRIAPDRPPELAFAGFRPRRDSAVLESQHDWTVSNGRFYVLDSGQPGRIRIVSRAIAGGPARRVVDVEGSFNGSLVVDPLSGDIVFGEEVEFGYDIAVIPFSRH
jgi:hypothetical protein